MHIGETIVAIRNEKGMTQAELAQKMGVKPQTISQYERGIKNPKPATIKKFADALGVDAAELYATNAEQREERALQTMGYTAAEIIAMKAAQKVLSNTMERYSPLELKQIMNYDFTPYLRTLRGEGAGVAASVEQGDTPHGSRLPAAPGSTADKAANLAHLMGRISAGDIPDAAGAAPAQVEQLLQDFNKLNSAGQEKALERVHELTEVPRYTSPAVTPAPASTAESAQAAPQSPAGDTDTHKEG